MPRGRGRAALQQQTRMIREQLELVQTLGGPEELVRRAETAKAALAALPPGHLDRVRRHIMGHEVGIKAAVRLTGAALEAGLEHALDRHGPAVADHAGFLAEFGHNLALFASRASTADALERADLLAATMLPAEMSPALGTYQPSNVAAVQAYTDATLIQLERDHARDANPVIAWEAFDLLRRLGQPAPDWVMQYLEDAAAKIMGIAAEAQSGKVGREANRVGKALGFGTSGPGRGGAFGDAMIQKRDRAIFRAVESKKVITKKLDAAYNEVATALGYSRTMVIGGYNRVKRLTTIEVAS